MTTKTKFQFKSKGRECVITSKKFPELLDLIVSADCWDTDSDCMPVIGMAGEAVLKNGKRVKLRGSRDVGIHTGYDPQLVIAEAIEKKEILEWVNAGTVDYPVLPQYNSVLDLWWYNPDRTYSGLQSDHKISAEEAEKIVAGVKAPVGMRIVRSHMGYEWQKKELVSKDIGLGRPDYI
jgi:hypothetical protein